MYKKNKSLIVNVHILHRVGFAVLDSLGFLERT